MATNSADRRDEFAERFPPSGSRWITGLANVSTSLPEDRLWTAEALARIFADANESYFRFDLSAFEIGADTITVPSGGAVELTALMVSAEHSTRKLTAISVVGGGSGELALRGTDKSTTLEPGRVVVFPSFLVAAIVSPAPLELAYAHAIGRSFR